VANHGEVRRFRPVEVIEEHYSHTDRSEYPPEDAENPNPPLIEYEMEGSQGGTIGNHHDWEEETKPTDLIPAGVHFLLETSLTADTAPTEGTVSLIFLLKIIQEHRPSSERNESPQGVQGCPRMR